MRTLENVVNGVSGVSYIIPALVGAAIGGIMAGAAGVYDVKSREREARKNRHFQSQMSNTSHVREVADLRKAGLNPILSATGGLGGASTPPGATAAPSDLSGAIANSARTFKFERDLLRKQGKVADTQAQLNIARAKESVASAEKTSNSAAVIREQLHKEKVKGGFWKGVGGSIKGSGERKKKLSKGKSPLKYKRYNKRYRKLWNELVRPRGKPAYSR